MVGGSLSTSIVSTIVFDSYDSRVREGFRFESELVAASGVKGSFCEIV